MELNIYGCRGSIPSSSPNTVRYGGNTSCYEILVDNKQIILDTGSGFRNLRLQSDRAKIILYSHWHHDHIQGLPFNGDLFIKENSVTICSALATKRPFRNTLQTYFSGGYFPVDIVKFLPNLTFVNFNELQKLLSPEVAVDWLELNHPGGAAGYSIKCDEGKISYLCDNEFEDSQLAELSHFVKDSDIVIWDGMFTDAELPAKKGWGHSSIEQAIEFYKECDVKKLLIAHHDPGRLDSELDELSSILPAGIEFAHDGMKVSV